MKLFNHNLDYLPFIALCLNFLFFTLPVFSLDLPEIPPRPSLKELAKSLKVSNKKDASGETSRNSLFKKMSSRLKRIKVHEK